MKKFILSIVVLLMGVCCTQAQDIKVSFTKLNDHFSSLNKVSYSISYAYYQKTSDKKPLETSTGQFKRLNNNFYSKIGDVELIINEKYKVVIDNDTKHVVVEERQQANASEMFMVNLDSALALCSKISSKATATQETFSLFFDSARYDYTQVDVVINKNTSFIDKLVIYMVATDYETNAVSYPKLEISLFNYTTSPIITEGFFSETNYVSIDTEGNVSLNKKYSAYRLLNTKVSKK
ncbi:MAG TPA: hypothetical protein VEC12_14595 [Bacteroidia bacterium]|nr:hypothetical protein [Bacteroidia bacterium]